MASASGGRASQTIVLCYHGISETWPGAVKPSSLAAQVRLLLRRGYSPVRFSRAVLDPPPGKALAVTFDDGYRSILTDAFPILAAVGVPGTVFVPTDFVGATAAAWPGTDCWIGTAHEHELMPMTWEELGILQDAAWEVGSHARTHARLVALGDAELADELIGSRAAIERVFRHDGPLRFRAKVSPSVLRLRATRWWSLVRPGRLPSSSRSGSL